jgi:sulfite reductase (NADPH) flavoprotein alpha-component
LGNRRLNGDGSAKETRHIEIGLAGSGLSYEVGDALGVIPSNCPEFVTRILSAAGLRGSEPVADAGGFPLRLALQTHYDLSPFLSALPASALTAEELVSKLRKLQPRLYSISSSPKAHPNEVHLTVGIVRYDKDGVPCKGVCSTFLAERTGGIVPVFVHSAPHFRLPEDSSAPMIMIGPGTGIAPFRAFLEERRATAAAGKSWLFFGDQRAATDFLYREELEAFLNDGTLTRLDTAFSRDQAEKIYVQDRMLQNAAEFWAWLQAGAYVYVCGDATRMAKDVDAALHTIAAQCGTLSTEEAAAYVTSLREQKRYRRDVY